jgi:hypothetical protein
VDEMSSVTEHKRERLHDSERRTSSKAQKRGSFALLVKSAVVVSWVDLFSGDKSGTVHVDCRFGDENVVEQLTIWVATERGEWRLVGEYSMSRAKKSTPGLSFESGYRSDKLSCTLDTILEHQHSFAPLPNAGRDGLIEIEEPTPHRRRMAESTITSMLRSLED